MRDMTEDERKVFDEKMDYISKLKDSMTQEEMDCLLPTVVVGKLDVPRFDFSGVRFYPRRELNECLEAAYTGTEASEALRKAHRRADELQVMLDASRTESDGYVTEIERLEKELEETRAELFRVRSAAPVQRSDPDAAGWRPSGDGFHPAEADAFMVNLASSWMQNHRPQTPTENVRSYQLAKEFRERLLESVDLKAADRESRSFRSGIESAVDECFSRSPTDIAPLIGVGFVDRTRKNSPHWRLSWRGMDDYMFVIPKTPSDSRAVENCKKAITQRLCI